MRKSEKWMPGNEMPKFIWAGMHHVNGSAHHWYSSPQNFQGWQGVQKYIRTDAPELVALVESLRPLVALSQDIGPQHDCATVSREQCDNAASAMAQWDAMIKPNRHNQPYHAA